MPQEKIIKFCDRIIEFGVLAVVFFMPLIFDFTVSSYNAFDIYKIIFLRVTLNLILIAFAAKVFISGRFSYRGSQKFFWLVFLLGLSFFISSFASIRPNQSFWGSYLRQYGFYNFLNYLLFFVLLILNIKDFIKLKRIMVAAVASASLATVYGLVQFYNLDPLIWAESSLNAGRIFSTFGQPNFFGHWLIMVLPFSLYTLIFIAKKALSRFFAGLAIFAQLVCLLFTYSRAAWLGFLGSIFFLAVSWLFLKRFKKTAYATLGLILIGLAAVISLNIIKPSGQNRVYDITLANRLKSLVNLNSGSGMMRLFYLQSAIQEIRQEDYFRLFLGYGPETLNSVFVKYYQPIWGVYETINGFPDRAHNWLFDQILSLGFLGLAVNAAFYVFLIYKAAGFFIKKPDFGREGWLIIFCFAGLTAYFINNFFSFSLPANYLYLYLILAIVWLVINFREDENIVQIRLATFSKWLIGASFLAVSVIFIYANNFNQIRAEIYYAKAIKSMASADCGGMIENAEEALSLSPNNGYYSDNYLFWLTRCFIATENRATREDLGRLILPQIESIKDKEFYDTQINLARLYAAFGFYLDESYYHKSQEIYSKLILFYPNLTIVFEDLGKLKMYQGDYQSAVNNFKQAISLLPPIEHPALNSHHRQQIEAVALQLYENLGQVYFKTKEYDLALDAYRKGLSIDPHRTTLYKNIADVYYVQNNWDKAVEFNRRGYMLSPKDYNWPLALSLLYRDKKDLTEAKKYLDQAIKLAPENEELKKYERELNK